MNYQELFPGILENTYPHLKDISTKNLPKIKMGGKVISLPFLDTVNIKKLSIKDVGDDVNCEIRTSEWNSNLGSIRKLLTGQGFNENEVKGHIVSDLKSIDYMWENFHKHTRNDIRMAEKSGLEIKTIDSMKELKNFYKLYLNEMRNFGTPQHSFKFFKNCFRILNDSFRGLNCYKEGEIIGSIILFLDEDYAYVAYNISKGKFRKYRPNDMLYWSAIKWCISHKITSLDMGQIDFNPLKGSRELNLLKFKKKWLGREYKRIYFTKGFSIQENKSNNLKKFRVIWRFLPKPIVKIFGPKICSRII